MEYIDIFLMQMQIATSGVMLMGELHLDDEGGVCVWWWWWYSQWIW